MFYEKDGITYVVSNSYLYPLTDVLDFLGYAVVGGLILFLAWRLWVWKKRPVQTVKPSINDGAHGSATWAQIQTIRDNGLIGDYFGDQIPLGCIPKNTNNATQSEGLVYGDNRHLLTVAPSQSGKGTSAIIPTLLTYKGGVVIVDPKGENAAITACVRASMGHDVYIFDPWAQVTDMFKNLVGLEQVEAGQSIEWGGRIIPKGRFNPLEMIDTGDDLADDCFLSASSIVMTEQGADSHWSDEAEAMIAGIMGELVTNPEETKTLKRLREVLNMPPDEFMTFVENMYTRNNEFVKGAAGKILQKTEKELSSVLSTAQRNTHYLEGPAMGRFLSGHDVDFSRLKSDENPITVYIVIPAERIGTHARLLRQIIAQSITMVARDKKRSPKRSALFILDEFAQLGRLKTVQDAFGLMAGYGMRVWPILQDLTQLKTLYKDGWETFVSNAGIVQFFTPRDLFTAEYISKMAGSYSHDVENTSQSTSTAGDGNTTRSTSTSSIKRELITTEEVMKFDKERQIIFANGMTPIKAKKIPYFENFAYLKKQYFDGVPHWYPCYAKPNWEKGTLDIPHMERTIAFEAVGRTNLANNKKDFPDDDGWFKLGRVS